MEHQEILDFLKTDGGNPRLAKALDKNEVFSFGPILYPIANLKRIIGPEEEGLKYSETLESWEERIGKMMEGLQDEWNPKPLISTNFWSDHFTIADGNHRQEALLRSGIEMFPVVFYFKSMNDMDDFVKKNYK